MYNLKFYITYPQILNLPTLINNQYFPEIDEGLSMILLM
jgi:hypothetical protein